MGYYDQHVPPVRDQRLTIGDSFSGRSCELLNCAKSGCLMQKSRSFWQAGSCQMGLALVMASTIPNSVIILHAPIGCGAQQPAHAVSVKSERSKRGLKHEPMIWLSTNLTEADVIGGGAAKLYDTILYADREFHPEIIFIVSTCTPNIIGDDVDDVIRSAQRSATAEVTAVHCPGFKTRVVASAYDSFYHSLIRKIGFEAIPGRDYSPKVYRDAVHELAAEQFKYRKGLTVNLFNATSMNGDDEKEAIRLLNALDLNVRVYAEYSSLEEFRRLTEASLNISMCNVHDDYMLSFLEEKYGMPYMISGMPLGPDSIRTWLKSVARFFGKEELAGRICDYEETRLSAAIEPFLPKLKGKRALLGGGVVRVAEDARLLNYLGLEVIGVRAYHYDIGAEPVVREVSAELPGAEFAISNQLFELVNQVRKHRPDLVVSHAGTHGWLAKLGFPSVNMFGPNRVFFGYAGVYAFVKSMVFALENTSFSKRMSEKIKLPYRREWYEKEAFHYIKEG